MQTNNEDQGKDIFTLKRELAALMVQIRVLEEKRNKLLGKSSKRRPQKPVGRNAELWPDQAMMILGVSRRRLATMLKTGQLADLHPYSIGKYTGRGDARLIASWKAKYEYWKLQWVEFNEWQTKERERRAQNALKFAESLMSPPRN